MTDRIKRYALEHLGSKNFKEKQLLKNRHIPADWLRERLARTKKQQKSLRIISVVLAVLGVVAGFLISWFSETEHSFIKGLYSFISTVVLILAIQLQNPTIMHASRDEFILNLVAKIQEEEEDEEEAGEAQQNAQA